jgi:hypothetical protein
MEPTVFGIIVVAVGAFLWRYSVTTMLCFVMVCTLFGSTAALYLTALGNSTILPANLALLFLAAKVMMSPAGHLSNLVAVGRQNGWLVAYCCFGAATAYILPHIFSHGIYIAPLRTVSERLYGVQPVKYSSQNITTSIYLMGTLLAALMAGAAVRSERKWHMLVTTVIVMTWAHFGFGIADLVLDKIGHKEWLAIFRTATYAELDQEAFGGVHRIAGIFAETSSYSGYGLGLLALNLEFWIRNLEPKKTGAAAIAIAGVLMLTTSTTAYVGLAAIALLLMARILFTPMQFPARKMIVLAVAGVLAGAAVLALIVFDKKSAQFATDLLLQSTVHKVHSGSGLQRAYWAHRAIEAFYASYGLGVGVGSFRSSGIIQAIAGSTGVIGLISFFGYVASVMKPFSRRSHSTRAVGLDGLGAAFGWAAVIGLLPAMFSGGSPDPGLEFAVLCGSALALSGASATLRVRPVPELKNSAMAIPRGTGV